jgi:PAS domain S-box-containing protein
LTTDAKKVSPIGLVLETALDATVIMGVDGRVRDWNRQAEATFGWSRQEALGRPMAELIIPEPDRPSHIEGLRRHLETCAPGILNRRIEVVATDRRGRLFPVELSVARIDDGDDLSFVGFIRDISDRLTAQQALQVERDRSQSVLDNMLDALVLMDRDLRVLQVNQAALRMEGRSAESMLGRTHEEIWPGPEAERLRQRYREVLGAQVALAFEEPWNDGRGTMWLEIRAQPTPEGVAVFYRDVTKRKTAEAVLRDSEARLLTLANVAPAMVWMSSDRGEVEFLNDRWFAFTGVSPGAEVDPASLLHPDDAVRAAKIWEGALKTGKGFEAELRVRRGDGQFRWFLSRSEPVLDREGGVAGWIGASIDIDDRRRAQERLELMVNELNHRVKNNLAAVQSLAAQTFRGTLSLPEAREAFTARLMALSRAHDILTRQQWEGAQLAKIATDVLAPNLANLAAVTLEGPPVSLGPNAALTLSMAFHELCTNALKYGALSRPEGRVALTWAVEPSGMLHLTWTETGGPKVSPPAATGFGSRLLTRSLAAELRGVVSLEFDEAGVVCTIDAPLDHGRLAPASALPQITWPPEGAF